MGKDGGKLSYIGINSCKPKFLSPPGWKKVDLFNLPPSGSLFFWGMVPCWELNIIFFLLIGWNSAPMVTMNYCGSLECMCDPLSLTLQPLHLNGHSIFQTLCCHGYSHSVRDKGYAYFIPLPFQTYLMAKYSIQSLAYRKTLSLCRPSLTTLSETVV